MDEFLAVLAVSTMALELSVNDEGQGVAKILFPNLPLLRGNYYLDVALLCEKGIHPLRGRTSGCRNIC